MKGAGCTVLIIGACLFVFGIVFGTFSNQIGAAAVYVAAISFFGGIALAIIGGIIEFATAGSQSASSVPSRSSVTPARPVTPPRPKPTLSSTVPALPDEIYRTEVYGEKELLIVTKEKLIIWSWGGALSSVRLSLVNTATVGDHFMGLWQIWVHTSIGPVAGFWSLDMSGKEKAYEVAQLINNAVALYG